MKKPDFFSQLSALAEKFRPAGIVMTEHQIQQLSLYAAAIPDWNARVNLISRQDEANIVTGHIAESICLMLLEPFAAERTLLDIGTGAGFPGLPLQILRADLWVTLIESNRMKTLFLKKMTRALALDHCQVFCQRVENVDFQTQFAGRFDYIAARAVTRLDRLWQWAQGLLKDRAPLLAMKGGDIRTELEQLPAGLSISLAHYPKAIIEPGKDRVLVKIYRT